MWNRRRRVFLTFLLRVGDKTWWSKGVQWNASLEDIRSFIFGGTVQTGCLVVTRGTSMLEPGKNSRSLLFYFSPGYVASLCLPDAVVPVFIFLSFSRRLPTSEVVNKPYGSLTEFLAFVNSYHGEITTGSKFSLIQQWYIYNTWNHLYECKMNIWFNYWYHIPILENF